MTDCAHRRRVRVTILVGVTFTVAFFLSEYSVLYESQGGPQLPRLFTDPTTLTFAEWLTVVAMAVFIVVVAWTRLAGRLGSRCAICGRRVQE